MKTTPSDTGISIALGFARPRTEKEYADFSLRLDFAAERVGAAVRDALDRAAAWSPRLDEWTIDGEPIGGNREVFITAHATGEIAIPGKLTLTASHWTDATLETALTLVSLTSKDIDGTHTWTMRFRVDSLESA